MTEFFDTIGWSPTIGDPSIMGWFTVMAYFAAFVISLQVYVSGDKLFRRIYRKQKRLWLIIACLMLLLSINKQLDLQTLLTATVKYLFIEHGLYEFRRYYQEMFIIMILLAGIAVTAGLILEYRTVIRNHWLAILGLVFLMVFIVVRATSFHLMDKLISYQFLGIYMNWVLELTGIALIIANAFKLLQRKKKVRVRRKYRKQYT